MMERVTLERFYNDPQLLNRICAQAHRERAAMIRRLLGSLLPRAPARRT